MLLKIHLQSAPALAPNLSALFGELAVLLSSAAAVLGDDPSEYRCEILYRFLE